MIDLHFVYSGEEALSFLEKGDHTDLLMIFSDINMPKMNGLGLLKMIQEHHTGLQVFVITTYGDEKNRLQAMFLGASGYLTKPLWILNCLKNGSSIDYIILLRTC